MKFKKMLFPVILILVGLYAFSYTYYLPHIHTGSDSWETYLIMDNASDETLRCFVHFMGADGNQVDMEIYEIAPHSTMKVSLRDFNAPWLYISAGDKRLSFRVGYIAKDSMGGGTAEFSLPKKLLKTAMFRLSNYYDKLTWSGFALTNGLNEEIKVKPYIYTDAGVVEGTQFTMAPYQKVVSLFDDYFGIDYSTIKFVVFEADKAALQGVVISGKENEKLLFTAPSEASSSWSAGWGLFYDTGRAGAMVVRSNEVLTFYTYDYYTENADWIIRNVSFDGMEYIPVGIKYRDGIIRGAFTEYDTRENPYFYGEENGQCFVVKWDYHYNEVFHKQLGAMYDSIDFYPTRVLGACAQNVFGIMFKNSSGKVVIKFLSTEDGSEVNSFTSDKSAIPGFIFFDGNDFYAGYTYDNGNGLFNYIAIKKFDSSGADTSYSVSGKIPTTAAQSTDNYILDGKVYGGRLFVILGANTGAFYTNNGINMNIFSIPLTSTNLSDLTSGYLSFYGEEGSKAFLVFPNTQPSQGSDYEFYVICSHADFFLGSIIYRMYYSANYESAYYLAARSVPYSVAQVENVPQSVNGKTKDQSLLDSVFILSESYDYIPPENGGYASWVDKLILHRTPLCDMFKTLAPLYNE